MKLFKLFNLLIFSGLLSLLLVSCGEDDINNNAPKVNLGSGFGLTSSDASVGVADTFTVNITGLKGNTDMRTLTIEEESVRVGLERLIFSAGGGGNPLLLSQGSASSFDITVGIIAHNEIGTKKYNFVVTDEAGLRSSVSLNITTIGEPPVIETPKNNIPFIVSLGGIFTEEFKVNSFGTALKTVEVTVNGALEASSKLFYGNIQTPFSTNPLNIPAADANDFKKNLYFESPATPGTYIYKVKFTNIANLSTEVEIPVTVGTNLTLLPGVLFNQAGPAGRGGLDLDTGNTTGSADPNAEIRDEGIDTARPVSSNWRQQISGVNGSEVKYLKKGQNGLSENFSFDDIKVKEQMVSLWQNGVAFNTKSADNMRDVSNVVAVGDIFIIKNVNKYYTIIVKDVVVTSSDNNDNYVLDIKL